MPAIAASRHGRQRGEIRHFQRRLGQHFRDARQPAALQLSFANEQARADNFVLGGRGLEDAQRVGQRVIQRILHPYNRLLGGGAQALHPRVGVQGVVLQLAAQLAGHLRQRLVAAAGQGLEAQQLGVVEEKVAGEAEIVFADGQLHQLAAVELRRVAGERHRVGLGFTQLV